MSSSRKLARPAFLAASLALAACRGGETKPRIAVALPLTGDVGHDGSGVRRGVELALEGSGLELVSFDDRADPKEAVNVANQLVADRSVVAVIGHLTSGCSIPASRVYARAGLAMITPTAINAELTLQQGGPDWPGPRVVFRLPPLDRVQSALAAKFARKTLRLGKIAIVHDKTPYGQGLAETFRTSFEALGGRTPSFDGITVGEKDYVALLTRVRESEPDAVFFGGLYTEFGLLLRQARELGLKVPFLGGSGSKTNALFDVAGPAADGAYLTAAGIPVEALAGGPDFLKRYAAAYPGIEPTPFDHYGHMAGEIARSAAAAGGTSREAVREAVRRGPHRGLLGVVEFDGNGDNLDQTVYVTRADAARRAFVRSQAP